MPEKTYRHPRLLHTIAEVRRDVAAARQAGLKIGLVPTMGALHEGHVSLARAARQECEFTIVSIFVNPTQFAPHEDFSKYPRTLEADLALLSGVCDLVFAPSAAEIYPAGFSTVVEPPAVAAPLEGVCRPGHFRGVATVVLKLFNIAQADVAYFGQKDFQQALVIQRMVQDLDVPIEICVQPTVREPDGLAMSSRNRYLSAAERQVALALSRSLDAAVEAAAGGERNAAAIVARMRQILEAAGITRIEYVTLADPRTLQPLTQQDESTSDAVALIAAFVGTTRLIDNRRIAFK